MDTNDLKRYSVIVQGGSGVMFQPMNNNEYTYILSAKHNFYSETNLYDTIIIETSNSLINIKPQLIEELKAFKIKEGENYFPHKDADIAIVLIEYIEGFDRILIESNCKVFNNVYLCGFPDDNRKDQGKKTIEEKFSSVRIEREINPGDYKIRVELNRQYDEQSRIAGFSGGGLLRLNDDYISIIGIQSEVTSSLSNGQIEFVPIKCFNDIVENPENNGKLAPLLPPYMASFEFLKNEIYRLEEAENPEFITKIKNAFNNQFQLIDISPLEIYTSFKESLLIDKDSDTSLLRKEIWKAWLEYLLILSFIVDNRICFEQVQAIFNEKRLMHSDSDDSFYDIIIQIILKSNLTRLKENGVLIISTKTCPNIKRRINKGMLKNIFEVRAQNIEMNIDNASKIKRIKEIIHIKAFQLDCIIKNETILNRHGVFEVEELITDLKNKFHEFLESAN